MPKQKTIEEVKEQIAKVENDIRQGENKVKRLLQQNKQQERNDRTRRLIERGAIMESIVPEIKEFSGEQVKTLLQYALSTGASKETINGYTKAIRKNSAIAN